MIQPSPEQLALLRPMERASFRLGDFVARRLKWLSIAWNSTFMVGLLWLGSGRRLKLRGLEHLAKLDRSDSVILVCNHLSFFDFFTVSAVWFRHTPLSRRMFFPVRAAFFYDSLPGLALNVLLGGMAMFPPVLRDRKRMRFNLYALDRLVAELGVPGTGVGIHPEGRRNKTDDPYTLLSAQSGVGKVALCAKNSKVVPVFMAGPGNNLAYEFLKNLFMADDNPIDLLFGPPVALDELRDQEMSGSIQREATQRCMASIQELADEARAIAAARERAGQTSLVAE